jgi:predicted nucleotidyltransferase/DNA-binding XRE family transcriptional regulator
MDTSTMLKQARRSARLTQSELAARAGTSQPAVARYETGVASPSVRTLDRLLHAAGFRLALAAEPAPSAADLGTGRMRLLRAERQRIEGAVRAIGGKNVRVFGSVARGEDDADSDIDLLIDYDLGPEGLGPLVDLRDELCRIVGQTVDVAPVGLLRDEVAEHALAEAVPL